MNKINHFFLPLILLTAVMISFRSVPEKKTGVSIAVIINNNNPVNSLTIGETKLYWLRKIKTRWPDLDKNIKPVDYKTATAQQETFYSRVLDMSADEVETYFFNKQYQNAQKPQDKFSSDYEIISFVSQEEGAIGFIDLNNATADVRSKVKVVLTVSE